MKKYALLICVLLTIVSAYTCDMAAAIATNSGTMEWEETINIHYCKMLNDRLNECVHTDGRGVTLHNTTIPDGIFSYREEDEDDLNWNQFSGVTTSSVMLNHARVGSSGQADTPFHPFVWDSRTDSKKYTFMANGTVSTSNLIALLTEGADDDWLNDAFDHLHSNSDNCNIGVTINNACDSEFYFYWLIKNIEANRDVKRGLEQALYKLRDVVSYHCWRNFMFSDGQNLYLYKKGEIDHSLLDDYEHRIFYGPVIYIYDPQNPVEIDAYVATSQNIGLDYDGDYDLFEPIPEENELDNGDLVVIRNNGSVDLYEDFGCDRPEVSYLAGNGVNWKCFPVDYDGLYADDQIEETESYFANLYYWDEGLQTVIWNDLDDTDLEYTKGYKLELQNIPGLGLLQYDLDGVHVLEDREIPLDSQQNRFWIPYFVHGSASVLDAFEDIIASAVQIQAQYWTMWRKNTSSNWTVAMDPGKSLNCYYGKMYDVTLVSGHPTVMDYYDIMGYEEMEEYIPPKTEYFEYEKKLEYEAILIDTIIGSEPIEEVAVFEGEECIGASVFQGYPVFIRAFTSELNRSPGSLEFRVYTGNRSEPEVDYRVYDEDFALYRDESLYPRENVITRLCLALNGEEMPVMSDNLVRTKQYPDPFNPETAIEYSIPSEGKVSINIYNIKGQRVKRLLDADQTAGLHKVIWNGCDESGRKAASGLYFYELRYQGQSIREKMMLIK